MRKKILIIGLVMSFLLSACGKQSFSSESNLSETEISVNGESNKIEINETSEVEQFGASFLDPFVDGKLIYTIQSCNIYETLEEAKIEENVLIEPHSTYFSQDIGEQYQTISDFINEDGSIVDTHQLVVLEMQVKNEDAIGIIKKNEFNISNISIRGGENVSQYNVAYFSEAGKSDSEQTLHYELERGSSINMEVGYFVLKEDMENIVGAVSDSDVQFSINE